MEKECITSAFDFQPLGNREVTARFDGGLISSDGGGELSREVEERCGLKDVPSADMADYARIARSNSK